MPRHASLAPDWLESAPGRVTPECPAMLPLPAHALLASDWLSMCVAHIKRAGMRVGVYLCVTPSNRTERRVCSARLGGCACLVQLARWHDPIARARLGSAEQPIGLLGLGLRHQAEPLGRACSV